MSRLVSLAHTQYIARPVPPHIQTSRQPPPSRASPTDAFKGLCKTPSDALTKNSRLRALRTGAERAEACRQCIALATGGIISTTRSAASLLAGVTLSSAGVCVCYCKWSAVHAAVSCEQTGARQVALPWLQSTCRIVRKGDLRVCPNLVRYRLGGRVTSSPASEGKATRSDHRHLFSLSWLLAGTAYAGGCLQCQHCTAAHQLCSPRVSVRSGHRFVTPIRGTFC
jgi:hypothetical protein